MFELLQRCNHQKQPKMTTTKNIQNAKAIASQINDHIEDLENNGEWFESYELVKDYFNAFDINDDRLFLEVLNFVK